ncbi:MAG: hypothetical protein GF418_08225 [Chitinivibrionales bacterium]|nr:hypothetical protein [Chitinivibrionales bacterium]MBD3395600.1 hypothetical protein [Chitinivibrionales bacterium]
MRKTPVLILIAVLCTAGLAAKPELQPYGFLKGDFYYASNKVASWLNSTPTAVTQAVGDGPSTMAFSAAHSRFGLTGSVDVDRVTIGGKLELDFFSVYTNTNANANPRMRQAYAWVRMRKGLELRAGQQWDVFSPLNPTTNNTNANMWYVGNYGFRRPMFQLLYTLDLGSVVPCIQVSAGEGAKEGDATLGGDNLSLTPMLQGRLSAAVVKIVTIGVAGTYAAFDSDRDLTAAGFSADLNAAIHRLFALKGEFCFGSNLNNANIFTIGGSGSADHAVENIGFWVNVISKPLDFLHVAAGVGQEQIISEIAAADLEKNFTVFGDLIIPIGEHFSLAGEYQFIQSSPKQGDAANASVVDIAGKISF